MRIESAKDLIVYKLAYNVAMEIFEFTKSFSARGEICTDNPDSSIIEVSLPESQRSVAKRRYEAHFVSKLTDCDGENSETDSSLDFAMDSGYISKEQHEDIVAKCAEIGRLLGRMIRKPTSFLAADFSDL